MATLNAPDCIHVPKLYKGQIVDVVFEDAVADIYELGYVVDSDFTDPTLGLTWKGINSKDNPWRGIESLSLTWSEIEDLNPVIDITTITGTGFNVVGLDIGLIWSEIDDYEISWNNLDSIKTWDEIEGLSSTGLSWDSIDSKQHSWNSFVSSLDIKNISWNWNYLDMLSSDTSYHKGFDIEVPEGKNMKFRVRAEEQNSISDYLISSDEYIITVDLIEIFAQVNEAFMVLFDSELLNRFKGLQLSAFYMSNAISYISESSNKDIKGYEGKVTYRNDKHVVPGSINEDGVVSIPFIAQKTGTVLIQAEYIRK